MLVSRDDFEIEHQTQPCSKSCAITCVAMLLGMDASQFKKEWLNDYLSAKIDLDDILRHYNVGFYRIHDRMSLLIGHIYICMVPSLNIMGGTHQILVDARDKNNVRTYDPAKGIPGAKYVEIKVLDKDHLFAIKDDEDPNKYYLPSCQPEYIIFSSDGYTNE